MSSEIAPQVDIGSLTLQGLSTFTSLLAIFTSDEVDPSAVVQLNNLGSVFHTHGQYASRVPGLLRRCTSNRINNLGLFIGWKKGDTASIMAQSAGGQAIALLSLCLHGAFGQDGVGAILLDLSEATLPRHLLVSKMNQLGAVANLLSSRLAAIGFSNIAAEISHQICNAYAVLGIPLPKDLFDIPTREAMVELFYAVSRVFCEENCIVSISGTQAMGYVTAIISVLFPDDITLSIATVVIRRGQRGTIQLNIGSRNAQPAVTKISVEEKLHGKVFSQTCITVRPGLNSRFPRRALFRLEGCLADALQIEFVAHGVTCSQDFYIACCDMLVASAIDNSKKDIWKMLGATPAQRVSNICKVLFRNAPSRKQVGVATANENLRLAFDDMTRASIRCSCTKCDLSKGLGTFLPSHISESCAVRTLWSSTAVAIELAFLHCFVDGDQNATLPCVLRGVSNEDICQILPGRGSVSHLLPSSGEFLHRRVMRLIVRSPGGYLARSDGASTMIPRSLIELEIDAGLEVRYLLCEGSLLFKGSLYESIRPNLDIEDRSRTRKSISTFKPKIEPNSQGQHSSVQCTIKADPLRTLRLRTTLLVSGHSISVDLLKIIIAAMEVTDAGNCEHGHFAELRPEFHQDVRTTTVGNPLANMNKIAVVQTKGNLTAQLFACEPKARSIIQRDCCLDCAVEMCKKDGFNQIIVGL